MNLEALEFPFLPSSWPVALLVIALTVIAVALVRRIIRVIARNPRLGALQLLAPAISNLVIVVGMLAFSEAVPLSPRLARWFQATVFVVSVFIVLWLVRRATLVAIGWGSRRTRNRMLEQAFIPLARNLVTLFLLILGLIMVLSYFSYDVMSLVTALGVGSLAVGLAAKDILSHMFSGFVLIVDRNIRTRDRIKLGDATGEVEEIGLRSTRIQLGNGNTLVVPNSELVNTRIVNLSLPSRGGRSSVTLKVPIEVPLERVRAICLEEIGRIPSLRGDQAGTVHLAGVGDRSQLISLGFWIQDLAQESSVLSELHEQLLRRMEREGIPLAAMGSGLQLAESPP